MTIFCHRGGKMANALFGSCFEWFRKKYHKLWGLFAVADSGGTAHFCSVRLLLLLHILPVPFGRQCCRARIWPAFFGEKSREEAAHGRAGCG